jgi:uncharacterized protein YggE
MKIYSVVAFALVLLARIANAVEANAPEGPHVTTLGRGRVSAPADRAIIEITAVTTERSAAVAKNSVERMVSQLLDGLSALKIPEEDVSVGGLTVSHDYDYQGDKQIDLGFAAERKISVRVKEIVQIDPVLQGALKAGISQVDSVEFTVSNWGDLKERARTLAVVDAREKAKYLAEQFGGCLGDIYSIDTSSDRDDGTYEEIIVTARRQGSSIRREPQYVPGNYEAGQVEVTAQLSVVFHLKARDCS